MRNTDATAEKRATRWPSRQYEDGFTLIELLVVLVILGLVVTFVAPAMINQLGSAKHKIAQQSIERLTGIVDLYRLDVGSYPTTDQGLEFVECWAHRRRRLEWSLSERRGGNFRDPWGRVYGYRSPKIETRALLLTLSRLAPTARRAVREKTAI